MLIAQLSVDNIRGIRTLWTKLPTQLHNYIINPQISVSDCQSLDSQGFEGTPINFLIEIIYKCT